MSLVFIVQYLSICYWFPLMSQESGSLKLADVHYENEGSGLSPSGHVSQEHPTDARRVSVSVRLHEDFLS